MIPDEPARASTPSPSTADPATPVQSDRPSDSPARARGLVVGTAVVLAAVGFLSLAAILVTAFLQREIWPGFVLATYACLPIAFLLMVSLVVWSFLARRRG